MSGKMDRNKTQDEKRERLSDIVRIAVLIWSATMLTASYIRFPNGEEILDFDPTFIASVFSGSLAGFGIATIKNTNNSGQTYQPPPPQPRKKEEPEIVSTIDDKKRS